MIKKTKLAVLLSALLSGAALTAGAAVSYAAFPEGSSVVEREAAEGPRGGDNERPGDRQRRGGRLTTDSSADFLAAKGSGRGKTRVPGGSGCDDAGDLIEHPECVIGNAAQEKLWVAREASEGPRGGEHERPGDRQRGRGRG
jgi:hypothetical protein